MPVPFSTPPSSAAASATTKASQDMVTAKNPGVLLQPVDVGTTTLMFSANDMKIILEALAVYDSLHTQQTQSADKDKDDLSSLLDSMKARSLAGGKVEDAPKPLPNLYLGSIVYYSPANWSVWINGRKLTNRNNLPTAEFYVDQISSSKIELIWHPPALLDTGATWERITNGGAQPPAGIVVDTGKGRITLQLHPNQTFLPAGLVIREGLVKSSSGMATPITTGMAQPPSPQSSRPYRITAP
jgi:hypothetical protein